MIWLIGNKGMLGSEVERQLAVRGRAFVGTDMEVDICDESKLFAFAARCKPSWVINCSAYTAVDKAEDEEDIAYKINAEGVLNIARVAREYNAKLIHVSTDYVFDGTKEGEYLETNLPSAVSVYGKSKQQGEMNIMDSSRQWFIIRTSWLYGENGKNFAFAILKLLRESDEIRVVDDQFGSPTYTGDLADLMLKIVLSDSDKYGIYHFSNDGRTNWYEFARAIYDLAVRTGMINRDVRMVPIGSDEYPTKVRRPANSYLSHAKVEETFGYHVRPWKESLGDFMTNVSRGNSNYEKIR